MERNKDKRRYDINKNKEVEQEEISLDIDDEDNEEEKKGAPAWLSSYSDMMTDLMAIFVILFAFAMMSTSYQNKNMKEELNDMKNQMTISSSLPKANEYFELKNAEPIEEENSGPVEEIKPTENVQYEMEDEFTTIYELIKAKIEKSGYSDKIQIEKGEGEILLRFRDNLLFYPDSPVMRENSYAILNYIGDLLASVDQGIDAIEISGFTAKVDDEPDFNDLSWELSADRAITVLKFLVQECQLPNSKMSISGYSHHRPVAGNDTEQDRSLNRRVEIKIERVRVTDALKTYIDKLLNKNK